MIMNRSALVLDGNQEQADMLISSLKEIPYISHIVYCANYVQALQVLSSEQIDLFFFDIAMPESNGLELLNSFDFPPTIIVTNNSEYAIDAYDFNSVVDFIRKPITYVRLMRALNRATKHFNTSTSNEMLYLKVGRKIHNFKIDAIVYIEADGIYCKVWLTNGSYVHINDNISEVEKKLIHTKVIRLHKSYIFNLAYLKAFDSRNLWIGEKQFSLGAKYRSRLGNILNIHSFVE